MSKLPAMLCMLLLALPVVIATQAAAHDVWDHDQEVVIEHPERRLVERYFYVPRPYYTPPITRSYEPTLGRYYRLVGERRYLQRYRLEAVGVVPARRRRLPPPK